MLEIDKTSNRPWFGKYEVWVYGCDCIPIFAILNPQSMIDDHCVLKRSELKHQLCIATCHFNPKVSKAVKRILESNFKGSGK